MYKISRKYIVFRKKSNARQKANGSHADFRFLFSFFGGNKSGIELSHHFFFFYPFSFQPLIALIARIITNFTNFRRKCR